MEIAIFKDITTEDALLALEADGKKYSGLYVDMDDKPSRKYVKDQAVLINDLIKKVDRKRIDVSRDYKIKVEAEACIIISRLKAANEPYSLLIDAHKAERAKILADEKLIIELREAFEKKEGDHEMALLINKTFEYDRLLEIKQQEARGKQIADSAAAYAIDQQKRLHEAEARDKVNAENARLADKEHIRFINRLILKEMHGHGLPEKESIEFIKTIARKQLAQLTINY